MTRRTRMLLLVSYLLLITLFTGPILVRAAMAAPLTALVSYGLADLLLAINMLPLLVILVLATKPNAATNLIYWLPLLMALQLWPLPLVACWPQLWASSWLRSSIVGYALILGLLWLLAWLYISLQSSLG